MGATLSFSNTRPLRVGSHRCLASACMSIESGVTLEARAPRGKSYLDTEVRYFSGSVCLSNLNSEVKYLSFTKKSAPTGADGHQTC